MYEVESGTFAQTFVYGGFTVHTPEERRPCAGSLRFGPWPRRSRRPPPRSVSACRDGGPVERSGGAVPASGTAPPLVGESLERLLVRVDPTVESAEELGIVVRSERVRTIRGLGEV